MNRKRSIIPDIYKSRKRVCSDTRIDDPSVSFDGRKTFGVYIDQRVETDELVCSDLRGLSNAYLRKGFLLQTNKTEP